MIREGLNATHAQKASVAPPTAEGPARPAVARVHSTDAIAHTVDLLQKKPADASDAVHATAAVADHAPTSADPPALTLAKRMSPTSFLDSCSAGIPLVSAWRSGAGSCDDTDGQEPPEEPQAGAAYTRRAVTRRPGQLSGPL